MHKQITFKSCFTAKPTHKHDMKSPFFVFLVAIIATSAPVFSQNNIRGSVEDATTNAILPQAKIHVITNEFARGKGKVEFFVTPNEDGTFALADVPDGVYDVECTQSGYVTQKIVELPIANGVNRLAFFRMRKGDSKEVDLILTYASLQQQLQRKVTTASNSANTQMNAPATIYVVTAEDIMLRGYSSLSEILEDIPEVEVQDRASYYSFNLISFRGIQGSKKFIVMLDGIRISSFTAGDVILDKNISIRDAEQVEVLLGPAAALYGADAVTGVVNIISKKVTGTQVSAVASYGSFHTSDNTLSIGLAKGNFSVLASGSVYLSQEPNMPKFFPQDYDWYWNRYQTEGVMHTFGDTSDLVELPIRPYQTPRYAYWTNAKLRYKQWELGFQRNWQSHNMSISSNSGLAVAWKDNKQISGHTNAYLTHQTAAGKKWQLNSLFNWNWYEISPKTQYGDSYNRYTPVYNYAFNHTWQLNEVFTYRFNDNHQLQAGLAGSYTYDLPNGGRTLTVEWQRGKGAEAIPLQYYPGTQTTWIDGRDTQITQNIIYAYQANAGAFVQYQGNIVDKLHITAGARFDYFFVREKSYPVFNPRLGLVYKPTPYWSVKGFYGEAFVTPSLETLYADYMSIEPVLDSVTGLATGYSSSYAFIPNPALKPEKMRSGELGVIFAKGNWVASTDAYINSLTNAINIQPLSGITYLGMVADYIEQNINAGSLLSYGATAQLSYRLPFGKDNAGKMELWAAYSYSGGFTKDAEGYKGQLPYSAAHTVKGSFTFKYKGFHLNVRAVYRSRSYDGGVYDENGEFVYRHNQPFVVLNCNAFYRILEANEKRPALDIFVKIRNLANAKYYHASVNYSDTMFAIPQDPIRIMGGVRMYFKS